MASTLPPPRTSERDTPRPVLHAVPRAEAPPGRVTLRSSPIADSFADSLKRNRAALIDDLRRELLEDLRPLLDEVRGELVSAVETVRRELADRDADLSDGYEHLAERLQAERALVRGVVEGLDRLARRLPA